MSQCTWRVVFLPLPFTLLYYFLTRDSLHHSGDNEINNIGILELNLLRHKQREGVEVKEWMSRIQHSSFCCSGG